MNGYGVMLDQKIEKVCGDYSNSSLALTRKRHFKVNKKESLEKTKKMKKIKATPQLIGLYWFIRGYDKK